MASEVVKAVFDLLLEEDMQKIYSEHPLLGEGRNEIRKAIERITPNRRAQHSMEKCLEIARNEFEAIRNMSWYDSRYQVIKMFSSYLF